MVMHELVHYNLTNTVVDKKKNFKRTLSNPPGAINMERISRQEATFKRTGSFVVGQKLRESKWFTHEEHKVLCAVLETGFIVESRNQNDESKFGIAVWTPGFEKSKEPLHIKIYSAELYKNYYKVEIRNLLEFWQYGSKIRINNQNDKNENPNSEDVIRHQIADALKNKHKWHNPEHFTYWCRYGRPNVSRIKHLSDSLKLSNFGKNTGFLLLRNKMRRGSTPGN